MEAKQLGKLNNCAIENKFSRSGTHENNNIFSIIWAQESFVLI